MCVHSFAIFLAGKLEPPTLRAETGLLLGATGRFLIPELMPPPAARAPGHSSSHNVCVSSDLPTTTTWYFFFFFSHSSERRRLTISLANELAGCVRGQAHSRLAFLLLLVLEHNFLSPCWGKKKKNPSPFPIELVLCRSCGLLWAVTGSRLLLRDMEIRQALKEKCPCTPVNLRKYLMPQKFFTIRKQP